MTTENLPNPLPSPKEVARAKAKATRYAEAIRPHLPPADGKSRRRSGRTSITRSQYYQLMGLKAAADRQYEILKSLQKAAQEITDERDHEGNPDPHGHTSDYLGSCRELDDMLRLLGLEVEPAPYARCPKCKREVQHEPVVHPTMNAIGTICMWTLDDGTKCDGKLVAP